jgi:hypothetical protein
MQSIYIYNSDESSNVQIHSNTADIGYFCTIPIQGMDFPATRTSVLARPGEHGSYFPSQLYGERRVTLQGIVYATTVATHETRRSDLEKILDIERDTYGLPKQKVLKFTTQNGVALRWLCVAASSLKMDVTDIMHSRFLVDLVGDYNIEASAATTQAFTLSVSGGWTLPVTLPAAWAGSSGNQFTLVGGTTDAWPTITFTGVLSNPSMRNITTGKTFALTYNCGATETITANMRDKTVTNNIGTNLINYVTPASEWWTIQPGNNVVNFSTSGGSDTGTASFSYRKAYLGI